MRIDFTTTRQQCAYMLDKPCAQSVQSGSFIVLAAPLALVGLLQSPGARGSSPGMVKRRDASPSIITRATVLLSTASLSGPAPPRSPAAPASVSAGAMASRDDAHEAEDRHVSGAPVTSTTARLARALRGKSRADGLVAKPGSAAVEAIGGATPYICIAAGLGTGAPRSHSVAPAAAVPSAFAALSATRVCHSRRLDCWAASTRCIACCLARTAMSSAVLALWNSFASAKAVAPPCARDWEPVRSRQGSSRFDGVLHMQLTKTKPFRGGDSTYGIEGVNVGSEPDQNRHRRIPTEPCGFMKWG